MQPSPAHAVDPTPELRSRRRAAPVLVALATCGALLAGCGSGDGTPTTTSTSTTEPASQFGSSMGVSDGTVADVAALGDGPPPDTTWSVPVGVSVCGRFVDLPADTSPDDAAPADTAPENTAPDAPAPAQVTAAPGRASLRGGGERVPTLGDYADAAGIELGAGRLTLPEGTSPAEMDSVDPPLAIAGAELRSGADCGPTTAEVQVWVYSEDAVRTGDGILVLTQDLANVPFSQEGMAVVIALSPESSLPTLPPSALTGG